MSSQSLARRAHLMPLGDQCVLVRFADALDLEANAAAIGLARHLAAHPMPGLLECVPQLVSVLLRYEPKTIGFEALCGEIRLALVQLKTHEYAERSQRISITYGGEDGPDLVGVAESLGMTVQTFVDHHTAAPLRVLATGFAPGFVYCGLHRDSLRINRRTSVRPLVPRGSVLFAAGQTAITATPIPTGWSVIGRTDFVNFDAQLDPPTQLRPGDLVVFEACA